MAGRWVNFNDSSAVDAANDNLVIDFNTTTSANRNGPALLSGVRQKNFRVTFKWQHVSGQPGISFAFAATDRDHYEFVGFYIDSYGYHNHQKFDEGAYTYISFGGSTTVFDGSSPIWVQITRSGTSLEIKAAEGASEPQYWYMAETMYSGTCTDRSGMVGFGTAFFNNLSSKSTIDELRVEGYRDTTGNGSNDSWVTEHKDAFTIDANGHASDDPTHDAAGNMPYDGTCRYTFDAWNRLVKVEKAYRDPLTTVLLFITQVMHGNTAIQHLRHLAAMPASATAQQATEPQAPTLIAGGT